MATHATTHRSLRATAWVGALFLILVVMVFFVIRMTNDAETLRTGFLPAEVAFGL